MHFHFLPKDQELNRAVGEGTARCFKPSQQEVLASAPNLVSRALPRNAWVMSSGGEPPKPGQVPYHREERESPKDVGSEVLRVNSSKSQGSQQVEILGRLNFLMA